MSTLLDTFGAGARAGVDMIVDAARGALWASACATVRTDMLIRNDG
jgi:hypothetical protein